MQINKKKIILDEILKLPPIERVEIVESILSSFEAKDRTKVDEDWSLEVEKRIDDYDAGKIKSKSYDDVFSDLNSDKMK